MRYQKTIAYSVISLLLLLIALVAVFDIAVKIHTPPALANLRTEYKLRPEPGGIVHRDIRYQGLLYGGRKLDIYQPYDIQKVPEEGAPAMVFVHGGSWLHGCKEDIRGVDRFLDKIRQQGVAVISIDYTAPAHRFLDAPARNVGQALDWILHNAQNYQINPKNIGIYSASAGSHLVLEHLVQSEQPAEEWRFWLQECGPTDLVAMANGEAHDSSYILGMFPKKYLEKHSPLPRLQQTFPPTAVVHGDADELVDIAQAKRLVQKLEQNGTQVHFRVVPGAEHGFITSPQSLWIELENEMLPFMLTNFIPTGQLAWTENDHSARK